MSSPEIKPSISLGNILTILTMLVLAGIAWGDASASISKLRDDITSLRDKDLAALRHKDQELRAEINTVRDRSDGKVEALIKEMSAAREALTRISTNVEWLREQAMKHPKKSD